MIHRTVNAWLLALGVLASPWFAATPPEPAGTYLERPPARITADGREAIRQTPLLLRPNRPGHFYGNTARRIHYRRVSRGWTEPGVPLRATRR